MKVINKKVKFNQIEAKLKKKVNKTFDVHKEGLAYKINVFFKIFSILTLFVIIIGAAFFNRYTVVDLMTTTLESSAKYNNLPVDGWPFPIYQDFVPDEPVFTPFFNSILTILELPEGILFIYFLLSYWGKGERTISLWETVKHFWPIFIMDSLSSVSSAWYLFFIYISGPSYLITGMMLSSLWLPSLFSLCESIYYQIMNKKFHVSNIFLDLAAVLMNSIVFGSTLYNYYDEKIIERSESKMLEFVIYFCPLFQFTNLIYTWIYGAEHFFSSVWRNKKGSRDLSRPDKDYSLRDNKLKIALISSFVKIVSSTACLFLTQLFMNSPIFDNSEIELESLWPDVVIIIVSGFLITSLSFTSLQLGAFSHILPFTVAPMLGSLVMILNCFAACEGWWGSDEESASKLVYYEYGITCINDDLDDPKAITSLSMMLIYIFIGLPGWMLTCRHIYVRTPLKFLPFNALFSSGNIFSAIGSTDLMVTINRRRNNLNIDFLKVKMYNEQIESLIQEKTRQEQNKKEKKKEGRSVSQEDHTIETINQTLRQVKQKFDSIKRVNSDISRGESSLTRLDQSRFGNTFDNIAEENVITNEQWRESDGQNTGPEDCKTETVETETDRPTFTGQRHNGKTPYIFFCPTLYQEDDQEMETLVTSILRINRYRYKNIISGHNTNDIKFEFDFEVNVFFDNCFVNKIYRREMPKDYEVEDPVKWANSQFSFVDDHYESTNIIYKDLNPTVDNHILRQTSSILSSQPRTKKKSLSRKRTLVDFEEINIGENGSDEENGEAHLLKIKNDKGKEVATAGVFYSLREVNDFVGYLLKTMNSVAQKVPFENSESGKDENGQYVEPPEIKPPKITFWPYGIRLEYELPVPSNLNTGSVIDPVKFIVHLKDPELVQKGKRWSQTMYFNYLYGYKTATFDLETTHDIMFLALDGDIDFHPDALTNCMYKMQADREVGFCCGKIHPKGSMGNPLLWYQRFEYAIGHWFQKASEHVFGSVLCSPGCFSLIRAEALQMDIDGTRDAAIDVYASRASKEKPLDIIQWNQGEDRWLCTLLLKRGWRISYVAISHQDTNAPMTLKEYFNQRRRWGPSTLFNILDLLKDWKTVIKKNPNITSLYLLYTAIINVSSLLTASTVSIMLLGAFRLSLDTWGCSFCNWPWLPYFLTFMPPLVFGLVCYLSNDDNPKHLCVLILTWFYAMVMLNVMIVLIGGMIVPCGICSLVNQLFLLIISFYLLAGLLNITECVDLVAGIVYWMLIPTMLILLNIYMYFGLNNTSWGTRESDAQIKVEDDSDKNLFARWTCSLGSICETKWLITQRDPAIGQEEIEKKKREMVIKQSRRKYDGYAELKDRKRLVYAGKHNSHLLTAPQEYNFSNILGHYDITEANIDGKKDEFYKNEEEYWRAILETKLKPKSQNETSVSDEIKTKQNLLDLRNQFIAMFVFVNSFWLCALLGISIFADNYAVATSGFFCDNYKVKNGTFVDENGEQTYLMCSEEDRDLINPLSLVYLYFYLGLMVIQTIGMVIHRWESFIIYCSSASLTGFFDICACASPQTTIQVDPILIMLTERYGDKFEDQQDEIYEKGDRERLDRMRRNIIGSNNIAIEVDDTEF